MQDSLLYQVALTLVPQVGPVQAKILLQHCEPEEIFHAKRSWLEKLEGIGPVRAASIAGFAGFGEAEAEIRFIEKFRIRPLFLTDPAYPRRLLNCYDSPTLLYYRGEADLNAGKIVAMIGTRNHTDYGRQVTEKMVKDLAPHGISIVSGLAYGVDALAHKAALRNNLPTIGVLAHGLDQVYPPDHTGLAKDMIRQGGGLLTEFRSGTKPDKHHFPTRNRVVAGMSDAVIVIETGSKGGSMITAELANNYNRDVFAIPGRLSDTKSSGCHYLVRSNKAVLLTEAEELLQLMNWDERKPSQKQKRLQRELFIELTPEEQVIMALLQEKESVHIDEMNNRCGLSSSTIAGAILRLELQGIILAKPGKLYSLA